MDVFEWNLRNRIRLLVWSTVLSLLVILFFKYIFFYVWPFALGLVLAVLFEKPILLINKICFGKKALAATLFVSFTALAIMGIVGYLSYIGANELIKLVRLFCDNMSDYDNQCRGACLKIDDFFKINDGSSFKLLCQCRESVLGNGGERLMVFVQQGCLPFFYKVVMAVAGFAICFVATIYISSALNDYRSFRKNNLFSQELTVIHQGIKNLANVYFKVQLIILAANSGLCVATFAMMRNPYALILGAVIGLLDALPFFGTGTVLIPWAVFSLLVHRTGVAIGLVVLFVVTYFVRQILESRCMGKRMGTNPCVMLAVIYVGILVYGIPGVVLGPLAFSITKALVSYLKCAMENDKL